MSLLETLREMHAAHAIDPAPGNQAREAQRWLDLAAHDLRTAAAVAESDPAMALEHSTKRAAKSLVAHMLAAGWRPAGSNKHALMATYGRAALASQFSDNELDGLDIIRKLCNTADYDDPTPPSVEQLRAMITFAERIHDACTTNLPHTRISLRWPRRTRRRHLALRHSVNVTCDGVLRGVRWYRINVLCDGSVHGVWWYRTASDTGSNTVSVWRNGTLLRSAIRTTPSVG